MAYVNRGMKRKSDEESVIAGFIHNISPVKTSARNNPYFHGYIQVQTDVYQKLVCFDVQKHSTLNQAEMSKSPVKLEQITQVPNREDGTKTDILINSRSLVQTTKKLNFKFHAKTDPAVERKTIEEINNIPERNTVSWLKIAHQFVDGINMGQSGHRLLKGQPFDSEIGPGSFVFK